LKRSGVSVILLGVLGHREDFVVTGTGLDDFAVHLEMNHEAKKLVSIFTLTAFDHDRRLVECSPQTVGIFGETSSAAAAGGHHGIIAPRFQIGALGRDRFRPVG